MKIAVLTGASSGIGAEVKKKLEEDGTKVYNIDIKGGDLDVDLSCDEGRILAANTVKHMFPDGIDYLVCCAGVSAECSNPEKIISLNYYGAVRIAEELFPLLQKKKGNCVLISSVSIVEGYCMKNIVDLMLTKNSEKQVLEIIETMSQANTHIGLALYATAKLGISLWIRRHAALWGARGVHINCIAPGTTNTPMVGKLSESAMAALAALQVPIKYHQSLMLEPDEVADVIIFLLSKQSRAVHGAMLFVDGGTEPVINTEHVY